MSPSTRLRGIQAITFDAGGTLLHPYPSVGAVYREVALLHGRDYPEDTLNRSFRAAFHRVSKDNAVLDPEARERDFWSRVVADTINQTGDPPDDAEAFFDEIYETFAHGWRWRMFDGVIETLEGLRARGLRLGVMSNWDMRLHTVLEETGLRGFFDAVLISSEVGAEKPDIGIFRAAERALGCDASACLHVGDSRKHDLEGALAAGWRGLIVRHEDVAVEEDEIARLSGLLARLA